MRMAESSNNLEQEIAELQQKIAEKKAMMEGMGSEVRTEKEVLREVVREKIAATPPTDVLSFPSVPASSGASATEPPSYLSDELRPKIQEFAKVALEKSLGDAISLAKATKNAALIDAFHDYIVDELYEKLVAEAKLREVK